jgi:ABC-2 type transport system permease protein
MKLWEIFRFELAYQVRRVWTWLFFAVLLGLSFLMTRDNALAEALLDDFFLNSPFAVAKTTVFGSLIWLLVAAAVAGEAAARDVATGMHPLTYTVSASKAEYLGGRFLAAFVLNALLLLAVQAGILLAVYSPGVDAEVIGPFRPAAYLTAYGFLALPSAFAATAIQFSLAARIGRPMAGYLGSVLLFFMSHIVGIFLFFQGRQDLANLLDPIGVHFILSELSHLWTTIEKSTRLIELEGTVLTNRLLWLGIALGTLAITYLRFRFAHRTGSTWWRRRTRSFAPLRGSSANVSAPVSVPQVARTFGFASHARQTLAIAWTSFRTIATSWAGLALLTAIPLLTVLVVIDQMESDGVRLVPATARVISELTGPLSAELSRWMIIPLLIVFFAGELVWREREAGLGEITDAMPVSEWTPFLGKLLGIGLLLAAFTALQMAAGMAAQGMMGHQDFEIGLYLKILYRLQLPEYLLFAVLALVVHVLADQKYVGHLAAVMAYMFIALLATMLGIEHNLLVYGAGPVWSYTEMLGFGPSLGPWAWFKLYWAAARGGGEAALGARQGEGPRRADPAGAPSFHTSHGPGCRRGGGAHPHAGWLHFL